MHSCVRMYCLVFLKLICRDPLSSVYLVVRANIRGTKQPSLSFIDQRVVVYLRGWDIHTTAQQQSGSQHKISRSLFSLVYISHF